MVDQVLCCLYWGVLHSRGVGAVAMRVPELLNEGWQVSGSVQVDQSHSEHP